MSNKDFNRQQLKQCFIDLGLRAKELDEPYIQSISFALAACIAEGSDAAFAYWTGEFVKMRMNDIEKKMMDGEDEP